MSAKKCLERIKALRQAYQADLVSHIDFMYVITLVLQEYIELFCRFRYLNALRKANVGIL